MRIVFILVVIALVHGGAIVPERGSPCQRCGELKSLPLCTLDLPAGSKCKVHVSQIRPTQFSVGPHQVSNTMVTAFEFLDRDLIEDFLTYYMVPITIGPEGFFITDKHHHITGLHRFKKLANGDKWVTGFINENRKGNSVDEFWKYMVGADLVWLYTSDGNGPIDPSLLPHSVSGLLDDPYRDIAFWMKQTDVIDPSGVNYAEFMWANYYREYIHYPLKYPMPPYLKDWCKTRPYDLECLSDDYNIVDEWVTAESTMQRATTLSYLPAARDLPGYLGE